MHNYTFLRLHFELYDMFDSIVLYIIHYQHHNDVKVR